MNEYRAGGRRRIDRVLDPSFVRGLAQLTPEELRARREDAEQEEADLGYAERLLQGRLDLLLAEQERRRAGGAAPAPGARDDVTLAADLAAALAHDDDGAELERHAAAVVPSRAGEHRRVAEAAAADLRTAMPSELGDDELAASAERLRTLEQRAVDHRRRVLEVVEVLEAELTDRLAEGSSS